MDCAFKPTIVYYFVLYSNYDIFMLHTIICIDLCLSYTSACWCRPFVRTIRAIQSSVHRPIPIPPSSPSITWGFITATPSHCSCLLFLLWFSICFYSCRCRCLCVCVCVHIYVSFLFVKRCYYFAYFSMLFLFSYGFCCCCLIFAWLPTIQVANNCFVCYMCILCIHNSRLSCHVPQDWQSTKIKKKKNHQQQLCRCLMSTSLRQFQKQ